VDELTGYRTRSILCVPIIHPNDGIIGAVEMINKRTSAHFADEDMQLCRAFGSQVC